MKKIIMTGGGTAGHITPNMALIPGLRQAGFEVHYVGLRGGMEEKLIRPLGVPFYGIQGGKLRRYADIRNITDVFRISSGFFESLGIIGRVKPDIVFSKGGFVSCPVVWASSLRGVPVVSHESDLTVGLANKLSSPFARKICYTFPETGKSLPAGKGVYTGLPIRAQLRDGSRERGLGLCGLRGDKPVVLAVGGSQGSAFINQLIRQALPELLEIFSVCHIVGKGNLDASLAHKPGYCQFEYVSGDLPHLFAMADVVVTRGGATSLFELLALRKPHVVIPYSLAASRGDQIVNARSFARQGFGEVLPEVSPEGRPATADDLMKRLLDVFNNRGRYIAAMEKSPVRNGTENVLRVICETAGVNLPVR